MSVRSLKERGLEAAAAFIERVGMTLVERSWRCDAGGFDLVALDGQTVVFVTVKTVKGVPGKGAGGLSESTARKVRRVAESYLDQAGLVGQPWRHDRVTLLVVAPGRALLRHHRDVLASPG